MEDPKFEKYADLIWNLNPNGNYKHFKVSLTIASRNTSLEAIYSSYKAYHFKWSQTIGKRDAQYIGKEQDLLTPEEFVEKQKYKESYNLATNELDKALKIDIVGRKKMEDSYKNFIKKYNIPKL